MPGIDSTAGHTPVADVDRRADTVRVPALRRSFAIAGFVRIRAWLRSGYSIAIDVLAVGIISSIALGRLWCWYGSPWNHGAGSAVIGLAALVVLARHFHLPMRYSRIAAAVLAGTATSDAVRWYAAWSASEFTATIPVPLSVLLALLPALWLAVATPGPSWRSWRTWIAAAAVLLGGVLLHIESSAVVDHRRHADAIIVPGAKVEEDGEASPALSDRVRSAVALWRDGLAGTLVLSGGRSPDSLVSEPQAMRAIAIAEGVPDSAIICDENGWTTAATMRDAAALAHDHGWTRLLVVSHGYHLARIQILAADQGLIVATVPATETLSRWDVKKVKTVAREVFAWCAAWAGLDDLRHRQGDGTSSN
jgi:uncharacterized SAM-binding protein YcdF (DUF218 family)